MSGALDVSVRRRRQTAASCIHTSASAPLAVVASIVVAEEPLRAAVPLTSAAPRERRPGRPAAGCRHARGAGRTRTRGTPRRLLGADRGLVGPHVPTVAVVPLRATELSVDDLDEWGDGLKPLTSSQTAKAISWTAIGRMRNVYPATGLSLNSASRQALIIRSAPAMPQTDSHRGTSRDR